jgi:hypothetical protein
LNRKQSAGDSSDLYQQAIPSFLQSVCYEAAPMTNTNESRESVPIAKQQPTTKEQQIASPRPSANLPAFLQSASYDVPIDDPPMLTESPQEVNSAPSPKQSMQGGTYEPTEDELEVQRQQNLQYQQQQEYFQQQALQHFSQIGDQNQAFVEGGERTNAMPGDDVHYDAIDPNLLPAESHAQYSQPQSSEQHFGDSQSGQEVEEGEQFRNEQYYSEPHHFSHSDEQGHRPPISPEQQQQQQQQQFQPEQEDIPPHEVFQQRSEPQFQSDLESVTSSEYYHEQQQQQNANGQQQENFNQQHHDIQQQQEYSQSEPQDQLQGGDEYYDYQGDDPPLNFDDVALYVVALENTVSSANEPSELLSEQGT